MQQIKKVGRFLLSGRRASERFAMCHEELATALHLSKSWQIFLKAMNHSYSSHNVCPIQWLNRLTFHLGASISTPNASKMHKTTKMIKVQFPATVIQHESTIGFQEAETTVPTTSSQHNLSNPLAHRLICCYRHQFALWGFRFDGILSMHITMFCFTTLHANT